MKLPLTGGCQCGELRYEIRAEPLSVYACHCTECQRQSGSAFGLSLAVARSSYVITAGEPQTWARQADSGNVLDGDLCSTCGVRLAHHPRVNDKISIVKPGTLDDTSWLLPVGHIWTRSAQPWVPIPPDSVIFDGHPHEMPRLFEAWRVYRARM